jgi:hypothetical protein
LVTVFANAIGGGGCQARTYTSNIGVYDGKLGSFPTPANEYKWWKNRVTVPGGEIIQTFSPFQQKAAWQYMWNSPGKWYSRASTFAWPLWFPTLFWYVFFVKQLEYDMEQDFRANSCW